MINILTSWLSPEISPLELYSASWSLSQSVIYNNSWKRGLPFRKVIRASRNSLCKVSHAEKGSRWGELGDGCVELSPAGFFRALVMLMRTVHLAWGRRVARQCSLKPCVMCLRAWKPPVSPQKIWTTAEGWVPGLFSLINWSWGNH